MALETGLTGKVAIVTGGGTGLGRSIALALARGGVHIAVASRRPHEQTIAEVRSCGVRAESVTVDLAREDEVSGVIPTTLERLGSVDLLVCNAAEAHHESLEEGTTPAWQRTLAANLLSSMWLSRSALAHMRPRGVGSILMVGSTTEHHYRPRQAAYHVSKVALSAFARVLAVEAVPVRVNVLVPGRFVTPSNAAASTFGASDIPLGRVGIPDEVGPAAVFLLSDALASYITGAELVVSGGLHLATSGAR